MSKILSLLIATFLSINASANERIFRIELIVFEQEMPNTEVFDQFESKIVWPKYVSERSEYPEVMVKNMDLLSSYKKLSNGSNFKPLMYVGWIQSAKSNRFSKAVRITNSEGTIDGYFRIQRGHYLHMHVDIEYKPATYEDPTFYEESTSEKEPIIYRLNEKRRFKLNEMHYLDHPKFGILARISPVKK